MSHRRLAGLVGAGILSMALPLMAAERSASGQTSEATSIQGTLMSRRDAVAPWVPTATNESVTGRWYKTGHDGEAVIEFAGDVHVRMSPDTQLHVKSVSDTGVTLEVQGGKIYTSVPESGKTVVRVSSPKGTVQSSAGTFIVSSADAGTGMKVVDGTATIVGDGVSSPHLPSDVSVSHLEVGGGMIAQLGELPSELALESDGPDTRRRPTNEVRNEQTAPINAGEDLTPTQTPTFTPTETPTFTPTVTPTFTPTFTPTATTTPIIEGGGFNPLYLLPLLIPAVAIPLLLDEDDDDQPNIIVQGPTQIIPASP